MLAIIFLAVSIAPDGRGQMAAGRTGSGAPAIIERTVAMGDYRLHYKDQGTGAPTVVMEAGLCQTMDTWDDITAQVASFTRVFTYDRPGLGSSSRISPEGAKQPARSPKLRTSHLIVEELRELLRKAGAPAPYVLVGHSFGGLNVRLYASLHPDEVAGVVLIDSSNEEEYSRYALLKPPAERNKYVQLNRGSNCEFINLEASAVQLRAASALPPVPLTVISAMESEDNPEIAQARFEMQADLARRGRSGVHLLAERSGHFIQHDRPDIVIKAIRDIVDRARAPFIPPPTEDDFKQTRILHISTSGEVAFSGAALMLSGLAGWQLRKRRRRKKVEMNRAMRRQEQRKGKKGIKD